MWARKYLIFYRRMARRPSLSTLRTAQSRERILVSSLKVDVISIVLNNISENGALVDNDFRRAISIRSTD